MAVSGPLATHFSVTPFLVTLSSVTLSWVTLFFLLIMSVGVTGTGVFDVNGVEDPLPVVIGTGPCWLLRDGQLVQGTWSHRTLRGPEMARSIVQRGAHRFRNVGGGPDNRVHYGAGCVGLQQNRAMPPARTPKVF